MAEKSLSVGFTGDVAEETGVTARARTAVSRVKDEAGMVAAHAVDHPTVTGSALVIVGLVTFGLGYLMGASSASRVSQWYRWS